MILELAVSFVFGMIDILINLIPTLHLSTDFLSAMSDVADLINIFSYFLPINTVLTCLSVIFILQNAGFAISVFNFIIRKIPGIN